MASYAEDLARWRIERKQAEIADRVGQIADEYREASRERDQAIANGDTEAAAFSDDDCMRLEQEYAQYFPPQPPQEHPSLTRFKYQNQDYINKVNGRGAGVGDRLWKWVDWKLTAPPNHYDPARGGMGLQRFSPAYYQRGRDLLELYSEQSTGVKYSSGDRRPMKRDAARASGLLDAEYANAERAIASQGRFSWQQGK